jgi:hypothetical protein
LLPLRGRQARGARRIIGFHCCKAGLALYTDANGACCICEGRGLLRLGMRAMPLSPQDDLPTLTLDPLAKGDYDCSNERAKVRQEYGAGREAF